MEDARNVNRSVGAMLSGALIRAAPRRPAGRHHHRADGRHRRPELCAFLAKGITLYLIGEANDYTGKGLSGGRVAVRPSIEAPR